LNEDIYQTVMAKFITILKEAEDKMEAPRNKRKMEKQTHYQTKPIRE
jgi:hypothetical protein